VRIILINIKGLWVMIVRAYYDLLNVRELADKVEKLNWMESCEWDSVELLFQIMCISQSLRFVVRRSSILLMLESLANIWYTTFFYQIVNIFINYFWLKMLYFADKLSNSYLINTISKRFNSLLHSFFAESSKTTILPNPNPLYILRK
jgi:hypothetical protein